MEYMVPEGTLLTWWSMEHMVTERTSMWWDVEHKVTYETQLREVGSGTQCNLWNPDQCGELWNKG